ncbi:MAG TPA: hypothetical protein VFP19_01610, partial [Candidatus Limnocylindrales bacterium]|nr:hypothetical protein [Candidatus Limnocylindrales bacterium]
GELRGTLSVVPEVRWLKDADMLRYFLDETIDHELAHEADLRAVLAVVAATDAGSSSRGDAP